MLADIVADKFLATVYYSFSICSRDNSAKAKQFINVNVLLSSRKRAGDPLTSSDYLPLFPSQIHPSGGSRDDSFAPIDFFLRCCHATIHDSSQRPRGLKFILPAQHGYIARSDFLRRRLIDSDLVEEVQTFYQPRQYVSALSMEHLAWSGLHHILAHAVGGLFAKESPEKCVMSILADLDMEMDNKLSFTWLLDRPIPSRVIAFFDNRDRASTEHMYQAAKALGIGMIVLKGGPEHWLDSVEYSSLRIATIHIDMTLDEELPLRIVETISSRGIRIDGLISDLDGFSLPVAKAAAFLGLPCESVKALDICDDKYKQRMISGDSTKQVHRGDDAKAMVNGDLEYPIIVKPSYGMASEGVSKVLNEVELDQAVGRVFDSQYDHISHALAINVEEYCHGPELDANFVLLDGKVLFVEVADDFPKAGDNTDGDARSANFKETAMAYPSGLSEEEINLVKTSLHQKLLDIGLRTGVYHVEARVGNSSKQYGRSDDGLLDLIDLPGDMRPQKEPNVVLMEVNPRLPGAMCLAAVRSTYGVDYTALHLLLSVRDDERAKALSLPFASGPQNWSETVFILGDKGGTFASEDVYSNLKKTRPELARSVSDSHTYYTRGQMVPPPTADSQPWIAWLLVFSPVSRKDLLEKARRVQEAAEYTID